MFNLGARDPETEPNTTSSTYGASSNVSSLTDIGTLLRERRETMGVSLEEVEVATRIRQKYLSAIEADDWHLLPGEIVGRGFLRNYALYLDLDPEEILERRRSISDPRLLSSLANTSAGSPLPPIRQVDYRPKEVDLKDDPEGVEQTGQRRLLYLWLMVGVLLIGGWYGITPLRNGLSNTFVSVQTSIADFLQRDPIPEPTASVLIAEPNSTLIVSVAENSDNSLPNNAGSVGQNPSAVQPTATATPLSTNTPEPTITPIPPTPIPPTFTPTPIPPTPIPPTPIPPTPIPPPTLTPTPVPPPIVAPVCADSRVVIRMPGSNQILSGVVEVTGIAIHELFEYYKVEYAPGGDASGGFLYLGGDRNPVNGGRLWAFDSNALANGLYTIQLTVVDNTGNFPPPCKVTVTVQN
ncbi:helix-turn-helix domain-containing protein [Chloroflexi bacterium TSY]|nr:helix-turn-helix domain-containing protein [Chloroflexi bacterium TSY]